MGEQRKESARNNFPFSPLGVAVVGEPKAGSNSLTSPKESARNNFPFSLRSAASVQPQGTVNTGLLSVVLSVNHGLVQLYPEPVPALKQS